MATAGELRQRVRASESASDSDSGGVGATKALTSEQTKAREQKIFKIAQRLLVGSGLFGAFLGVLSLGHAYVCFGVIAIQFGCFAELSSVRIKVAEEQKLASTGGRMPWFRTIQYLWFFFGLFHTWGSSANRFAETNPERAGFFLTLLGYHSPCSLVLFSSMLIASVLSLRKSQVKYQMSQYAWTAISVAIIVVQLKYIFQLIYTGLFWFLLPTFLVITNDTWAYFWGMALGRKVWKNATFLEISPNKTWEGFIFGGVTTVVISFVFSGILARSQWMVCPPTVTLVPAVPITCTPEPMYQSAPLLTVLERMAFESIVKFVALLPGSRYISCCPAQIQAINLGFFASLVAPFGGFMASAIKRAYGIKDFNNIIPGHGGLMDRMDCQAIMLLGTSIHLRTFVWKSALSAEAIVAAFQILSPEERQMVFEKLKVLL